MEIKSDDSLQPATEEELYQPENVVQETTNIEDVVEDTVPTSDDTDSPKTPRVISLILRRTTPSMPTLREHQEVLTHQNQSLTQ